MMIPRLNRAVDAVCREPYRLFFPIGIWMGLVGVSPWLFYGLGLAQGYSTQFHSSMQTLVYMNCFIIGFLTTFIPRFTGTAHANRWEVFSFLFILIGISVFLRLEYWLYAHVLYIIWLTLLVRFAVVRRPERKKGSSGQAPREMIWIPLAILHGIIGTTLLLLGSVQVLPKWAITVGKPMMEQGFLLGVIMGVGGFLIPRLMGTFQSQGEKKRHAVSFHLGGAALFFLSFWLEGFGFLSYGYLLRALVMTATFTWSNALLRFPLKKDLYIRLAWISVWMVVLGLWLAGLFSQYHIVMLHFSFIGGFSLMIYAVATMVVLSHIGEGEKLNRPLVILWIVALALALALIKRAIVVAYPEKYFQFLGFAALSWSAAAVCWLVYILPKVFTVPAEDEFARMHEQAKKEHLPDNC